MIRFLSERILIYTVAVCRLVSPSPPPRPVSSTRRKNQGPPGVFQKPESPLYHEESPDSATKQSLIQVKDRNLDFQQLRTNDRQAPANILHDRPTPISRELRNFAPVINQANEEEEDREEEELDPEEFQRKNEAIRKWLMEQPDPSEYVENEIQRARRQKDSRAKKDTQVPATQASNKAQGNPNEQTKPQSPTSRPAPNEPVCVALARRSLLARTWKDPFVVRDDDVPVAMDVASIPMIAQAQADTVQFILEKRERSASLSAGAEGDEILEAQKTKNYNTSALFCLDLNNPIRRAAIALIEWIWLEVFMLITTFLNCIFMSLYDPCDNSSRISNLDKTTSYIFIFIYFSEFLLKITAMGFITGQYSYLKDNWNRLDFLIVITGILDSLPFETISTSFTAFRLLRPLRAIRLLRSFVNTTGYLKDLDLLIRIIVSSSRLLIHMAILIGFIMFAFGMIGVVLFEGSGRGRCYNISNGTTYQHDQIVCSVVKADSCPVMFACLALGDNPNMFQFDDIGHAALVVLQTMTMRGWTQTLETTEDGSSAWANVYFFALLAVGPFFVGRLFLVILADHYTCIEAESKQAESATLCLFEVRVGIIEAKHLPRMDTFGEADPYVEVRLGNSCKVTKVIKNTLSPEWHEYFTFSVTSLGARLAITMFDWNRFGSHEFIGRVSMPVGQLDDTDEGSNLWYELEEQDSASSNGAIHVILQWRRNASDPWPDQVKTFENKSASVSESKVISYSSKIANSRSLYILISAVTTLNVIGLAMEYDCELTAKEACIQLRFGLDLIYLFCTAIFLLENIIRLVAFGVVNYFKDSWNIFNTFVVILGICEIPILVVFSWNCAGPLKTVPSCVTSYPQFALVFMKVLRIIRIFKFAKHMIDIFPIFKRKFEIIKTSAIAASTAIPVIFLVVLMAAILGMNIFGGFSILNPYMDDSSGKSRLEVGSWTRCHLPFDPSSRTCRIMAIDSTRSAPYLLHSYPTNGVDYWAATKIWPVTQSAQDKLNISFIVGLVPRGNFDSFFAATVTSFQLITLSDFDSVWSSSVLGSGHSFYSAYFVAIILIGHYLVFNLFVAITLQSLAAQNDWQNVDVNYIPVVEEENLLKSRYEQGRANLDVNLGNSGKTLVFGSASIVPDHSAQSSPVEKSQFENSAPLKLYRMRLKSILIHFVDSPIIQWLMFVCLITSIGASFVLQAPLEFEADTVTSASIVLGLNALLFLELSLKVSKVGYRQYCCNLWNCLDTILIIVAMLYAVSHFGPSESIFSTATGFMNSFQSLRLAKRSNRLRSGISSIVVTFVPALSFVAILLIPVFIFGLLGVQILAGKLHFCSDPDIFYKDQCFGYDNRFLEVREWRKNLLNFDWIGNALLSIFSLVSMNDWTRVMWSAVDATGQSTGPYENNFNTGYLVIISYSFILIVLMTGLFGLNIFIGVFVDTYKKRLFVQSATECVRNATQKKKSLSTSMKSFTSHENADIIDLYEPDQRDNKYRNAVFHVIVDNKFELVMMMFLLLNILLMPFQTYKASKFQIQFLEYVNFNFSVLFALEAMAKIYALYPLQYFESRWNRFDFAVVIISYVDLLLSFQGAARHAEGNIFRVFRVVRVLRAFRIFKFSSVFKRIIDVMSRSFQNILELSIIFALVLIISGFLCVEMYGDMCEQDISGNQNILPQQKSLVESCLLVREDSLLPRHRSFKHIGIAILTLVKLSTRDKWEDLEQSLKLSSGNRPSGLNATLQASRYLDAFIRTGHREMLDLARGELPGCQSAEELTELRSVGLVSCGITNGEGPCKSNCGSVVATSLLFPAFICVASFVILSLVLAVLLQRLQEMNMDVQKQENLANRSSGYKKNLRALMNVNEATVYLRNKIQN